MNLNRQSLSSTLSNVARVILGAALLLAILWGNIPVSTVATGPMCILACCAARAPHAAGSCMNRSCHADLRSRQIATHIHRESPTPQFEQFCGLPKRAVRQSLLSLLRAAAAHSGSSVDSKRSTGGQASQEAPDHASMSASSLGKPCQPDCSAGTFSSNQRRPRESATHSFTDRARPPSNPGLLADANIFIYARDAIRWQTNPRAPPALLLEFSFHSRASENARLRVGT